MPTLATDKVTLADWAKYFDKDGAAIDVAEILEQNVEILEDIPWQEGNLLTGHKTTRRAALPEPHIRGFNQGYQFSKSDVETVTETVTKLSSAFSADRDQLQLASSRKEFLAKEAKAHIQAFDIALCQQLIYGSLQSEQLGFDGFLTRYRPNSACDYYREQVIDAGGTGPACTSILCVGWSKGTVSGIFPKGSAAGLKTEVREQLVPDRMGDLYPSVITLFDWTFGLCVEDPRFVSRACNIDTTALAADPEKSGPDIVNLLVRLSERLHSLSGVTVRYYMSRQLREFLRLQITNKKNVHLSIDQVGGKPVMTFDGIPVKKIDAMNTLEMAI